MITVYKMDHIFLISFFYFFIFKRKIVFKINSFLDFIYWLYFLLSKFIIIEIYSIKNLNLLIISFQHRYDLIKFYFYNHFLISIAFKGYKCVPSSLIKNL